MSSNNKDYEGAMECIAQLEKEIDRLRESEKFFAEKYGTTEVLRERLEAEAVHSERQEQVILDLKTEIVRLKGCLKFCHKMILGEGYVED